MTQEPNYTSSRGPTTESLLPLPGRVKALAISNLLIGSLLAILNVAGVGNSTRVFAGTMPDALFFPLVMYFTIAVDMGLLFVVAGAALAYNRHWGRTLSFVAAGFCFVALVAGLLFGQVAEGMVERGELRLGIGSRPFDFPEPMSLTVFGPLYAIFVIGVLSLPGVRDWARSNGLAAAVPTSPVAKWSAPAIVSFICSLVPVPVFAQVAGLILGIVALVGIKESKGTLRGKALAVFGITISSALMAFVLALMAGAFFVS